MAVQTSQHQLKEVEDYLAGLRSENLHPAIILSVGNFTERGQVSEFYGDTYEAAWTSFLSHYSKNRLDSASYFRIDIVTEEEPIAYSQLNERISSIKRNNYGDFNFRWEKAGHYSFLMEELVGNALLKPSKDHRVGYNLPELTINEQNFCGYMKRKYKRSNAQTKELERAAIFLFKTKAFYFEEGNVYPLTDYGNGNRVREVTASNLNKITDSVIEKGSEYLEKQLMTTGQFIYGYYPCYDQRIKGYNSVRHFSSLYALAEAAEYKSDQALCAKIEQGIHWGITHLTSTVDGYTLVMEPLSKTVEYKLGAQATAILAIAKYTEVTGDSQFHSFLQKLIVSVKEKFITAQNRTIHVLDEALEIKEAFRIVYYDGEILFALLRAYGIFKEARIMHICEDLMAAFIANDYQKYHDHWLSYATNELLRFKEKKEYYQFGLDNALGNLRFIDRRDTAYPTMLELLVAASKMMDKLAESDMKHTLFQEEKDFIEVKDRINGVMVKRVRHELITGVMFPEFAQFFKEPATINYGFFARHDRFRMRIDDAEHFLSGLINYRLHTN